MGLNFAEQERLNYIRLPSHFLASLHDCAPSVAFCQPSRQELVCICQRRADDTHLADSLGVPLYTDAKAVLSGALTGTTYLGVSIQNLEHPLFWMICAES